MPTELTYFPATGYFYDVEAPLTGGSTSQLQFLVISAFITFAPRVPIGFTAQIASLDLGNGNTGNASLAIAPVTARVHDGQLSTIDATDTPGIQLLANSAPVAAALAAANISSLIYDVSFTHVVYAEDVQTLTNFAFVAPTTSTTVCITDPTLTRYQYQTSAQAAPTLTPVPWTTPFPPSSLTGITSTGLSLLTSADAPTARGLLGIPGGGGEWEPYANLAAFPATGNANLEYVAQDTGKLYRWNGSAYIQIADKAAVGLGNVDNIQQQPLDTDLTAIAALTSAANKVPYSTGAGAWALTDFTAVGRASAGAADQAAARTAIGAVDITAVTAAVNANGVVDLRQWDAIRNGQWQTSLGAHYTSGAFTMTNDIVPFTSADAGKIVIVNENPTGTGLFTRWMATILSVNGSGVATLDTAAPSSAVSQRIQWGFDCTTAINTALAAVAAAGGVREAFLPGRYRATQIVIPDGVVLRGAGWGSTYGGADITSPVNTRIKQLPGAEKDLIVFVGVSSAGLNWVGPVGATHMMLEGPEANVRGHTPTVGSGLSLRNAAGTASVAEDGCEFRWLHSFGFPGNGFDLPGGGVPLTLDNCRAFYNGQYGFDYNAATVNSTQMVHLMNCSADGNVSGAARFRNAGTWGPIAVTAFKSEANTSDVYGTFTGWSAVTGWAGVGDVQMSALIFEDCDQSPVIINGVSHIYGLSPKGPGPAILIKSATTKVPRITYNAVAVRIQGSETGSIADAVTLRDLIPAPDVDIPRTIVSGRYPSDTVRSTVTSAVTLGSTGNNIAFIGAGGAPTLPTAVGNTNSYLINNDDTVNHTLAASSGETIMGASSIILAPDESVTLIAKGTNWKVF